MAGNSLWRRRTRLGRHTCGYMISLRFPPGASTAPRARGIRSGPRTRSSSAILTAPGSSRLRIRAASRKPSARQARSPAGRGIGTGSSSSLAGLGCCAFPPPAGPPSRSRLSIRKTVRRAMGGRSSCPMGSVSSTWQGTSTHKRTGSTYKPLGLVIEPCFWRMPRERYTPLLDICSSCAVARCLDSL